MVTVQGCTRVPMLKDFKSFLIKNWLAHFFFQDFFFFPFSLSLFFFKKFPQFFPQTSLFSFFLFFFRSPKSSEILRNFFPTFLLVPLLQCLFLGFFFSPPSFLVPLQKPLRLSFSASAPHHFPPPLALEIHPFIFGTPNTFSSPFPKVGSCPS